MTLFILAINLMGRGHSEKFHVDEKVSWSNMTFEEIGLTEERLKDFLESKNIRARFFRYSITFGSFIFIGSLIANLVFFLQGKGIDLLRFPSYRALVPWGISDLIRVSIVIIFMAYLIGVIEAFIYRFFQLNIGLNLRAMLNTFFIDIAVLMVIFYFVIVKHKERLTTSLGLRFSHFLKNVASGVVSYIFILPFLSVVLLLSVWLLNIAGYSPPPQPVFEAFMGEERNSVLLFFAIFVSIIGPVVEEVFFRGFMYSAIKKRLGVLGAAFLSAALFSLMHTNILGFLPIMVLGLLLVYVYEKTGSLIGPAAVHILHNSIIVGFVFFVKELAR